MATRDRTAARQKVAAPARKTDPAYAPEARSDHLPPMEYGDMPEPLPLRKVLGPSVILAGVGVGSGEYILWPYITPTRASASCGWPSSASRSSTSSTWRSSATRWPRARPRSPASRAPGSRGASSSASSRSCRTSGPAGARRGPRRRSLPRAAATPTLIAIIVLLAIGVALTASPVVYKTLEKAEFFKVGLTIVFLTSRSSRPSTASAWGDLPTTPPTSARCRPTSVAIATMLGGARVRRRGRGQQPRASPTGSATRASAWARTSRRSSRR